MILLCLNLKNNQNFLSITCTQNIKNIKFAIETEDLNNFSFFRCQNYTQKQTVTSNFHKTTFSGVFTISKFYF